MVFLLVWEGEHFCKTVFIQCRLLDAQHKYIQENKTKTKESV